MGAVKEDAVMEGLRTLVPISALPDDKFQQLAKSLKIEELGSGQELFQEGDTDSRAVYLLSGKVVMLSGKSIVDTVVGGTDHARYPLAHHIPRQLSARSKSKVSFVRIDTQMLDRLLTGDRQDSGASYEVSDELEDDDWMTQLLQSEALANLPPENIQALFMQLEEVPLKAGKDVIRAGEEGKYFYLIRSGKCKVVAADKTGKSKVVAELGPGDSFGEEALISGDRRNATVTMLSEGILMRLEQENFDRLMKDPLINWVTYDEAADIVKQGGKWLDVRLPNEHSKVSIAGSKNLPLSVLRSNIDRLDQNIKYVTYCDNGTRSSVAAFLMSQRGIDSYVLAGGYKEPDRAPEVSEAKQEKPSKEVIDFNKSQAEARRKAEEEVARMQQQRSEAEVRAEEESRKRAALEEQLANMRAEQARASKQAEDEVRKRLDAERAVAQMKKEQENAFKKAQEEIKKRQEAEKEAARIKAEAEKARKKAEEEAAKLKAEREALQSRSESELKALNKQREEFRSQAIAQAEKLREEAEAARRKAEEDNARLKAEAEAARRKAEEDNARLREEADAARRRADEEAIRLQKEQEAVRKRAEAEAARLKREAEEIRKRAEVEARKRSEQLASEIVAEAEAARLKAEQEAAQLLAEAESARLDAQAEHARFLSSQQNARLEAQREIARLQAEAEQLRLAAEEEQRRMSEAEAQRLSAEEEASRLRSEAESTRLAVEEEAQLRLSEAETERLRAEEEATRIKAEAETARLRAEEEVARLAAEVEQARMSDDTGDATAMARLESEAEAARLEAMQAQRLKQEAEEKRRQAEEEAKRLKEEVEQTRRAAEAEARRLIEDAEKSRKLAEKEAEKVAKDAEKARKKAAAEADKLNARAEKARKKAEADSNRLQTEADEASKRAEEMIARMRREAEALQLQAVEVPQVPDVVEQVTAAGQANAGKEVIEIEEIGELPEIQETLSGDIDEIPELSPSEEQEAGMESLPDIAVLAGDEISKGAEEIIVLNEASEEPSSLLVTPEGGIDEISQLIDELEEEPDRSLFYVPEKRAPKLVPALPGKAIIGGGIAAVLVVALVVWMFTGDEETVVEVASQPEVVSTPAPVEPVDIQETPAPAEQPAEVTTAESVPAPVEEIIAAPEPDLEQIAKVQPAEEVVREPVKAFKPVSFRDPLAIGGYAPTVMKIPAGTFVMGSATSSANFDERPPRTIEIKSFAIGRHEVTVGDYKRYLQATGRSSSFLRGRSDNMPVTGINWASARQYAKWLSAQTGRTYRLPSEVEWEYAARGGTESVFWWGNELGEGNANCFDCGSQYDGKLAPVGQFRPNAYGLYDVAGNAMEWTQDCANPNYNDAPADASAWTVQGDCKSRMVRGGSFNSPSDSLRPRKRTSFALDTGLDNIGMRLVRE